MTSLDPEIIADPQPGEHIVTDLHEVLKNQRRIEQKIDALTARLDKWEPIANAALRMQQGALMRRLGRGKGNQQ
jgi:phage shock protein A